MEPNKYDIKMLAVKLKKDDLIDKLPAVIKDISKNFLAYCKLFRITIKEIIDRDMDKIEIGRLHKMAMKYSYRRVALEVCENIGIPKKTIEEMAKRVDRDVMCGFIMNSIKDKESN